MYDNGEFMVALGSARHDRRRWHSLCCVAAIQARAQSGAAILGTVNDAQGLALPGVELTLRNNESGLTRTTVSEGNGTYRFSGLPPGLYDVKADARWLRRVGAEGPDADRRPRGQARLHDEDRVAAGRR